MKIIDNTEKRNNIVYIVNSLIEKSFGRGWKGNCDFASHSIVDGPGGLKYVSRLLKIGKRPFFGILGEFVGKYAGQLGPKFGPESDGSIVEVFPEYEDQAKRYAELYERRFKKEVKVILSDEI